MSPGGRNVALSGPRDLGVLAAELAHPLCRGPDTGSRAIALGQLLRDGRRAAGLGTDHNNAGDKPCARRRRQCRPGAGKITADIGPGRTALQSLKQYVPGTEAGREFLAIGLRRKDDVPVC